MKQKNTIVPEPILQLQRQLDQFRGAQPSRTKLPEPLWHAAVEPARQYGVHPVAHPLSRPFRGTYYRAANWKLFGRTTGRGKASNSYEPNRPIKEALGFEMERLRCNGCRAVVHRGGT